jgi:hypothetical protein
MLHIEPHQNLRSRPGDRLSDLSSLADSFIRAGPAARGDVEIRSRAPTLEQSAAAETAPHTAKEHQHMLIRSRMGVSTDGYVAT